jgi:2-iminobutanoate/2-iminopropanoate deaminase
MWTNAYHTCSQHEEIHMPVSLDRRALLKTLGFAAAGAGSAFGSSASVSAQAGAARRATPRLSFSRAPLQNGIVIHAGETSMELYHRHPHDPREEIVQPEDIRLQTRLTLRNHKEILDWMGLGWKNVVKLTRYQKRMDESKQIEEVLVSYFKDELPPMTVYQIDGLSSPQARIEIDMWVMPPSGTAGSTPGVVKGIDPIFPRPEVTDRMAYAPGIQLPRDMDLIFFSGLSAYPWDVDPWNPGSFSIPVDPPARGNMATENLAQVLEAAGIGWQNIVMNVNYNAPGGGTIDFRQRWGTYSPCSTTLRVTDTGVPGTNVLYQLNAAAPRKALTSTQGVVPGIEPVLHRSGIALRDLPAAPAIRVSSDVDLVYLSGITAYPASVDPWNQGSFALPNDPGAQQRMTIDNVDRMLKTAGVEWNNIILLALTGENAAGLSLRDKLGDWRPCRTTRVVPTGIPGATVLCEITAVAPRRG